MASLNSACRSFLPQLSAFVDGELKPADRINVERHIGACQSCAMRVADLRAESGLVRIGLEMLADEVDFKDFSQKVMARLTPERPPLLERWRLALSELVLHERKVLVASFAAAAVALAITLPLALSTRAPEGYAAERMMVEAVSVDQGARVAPVVMETEGGDTIIWLVDEGPKPQGPKTGDHTRDEELDLDMRAPSPSLGQDSPKPKGGEL